jgi:RNA polymerase sigma factor (sigma-70 family)
VATRLRLLSPASSERFGARPHDPLAALAAGVRAGDPSALRTFLTTVVPSLIRVVRRVLGPDHPDVEDVAYEAAYAVVEALHGFRGESTVLHFACRVAVLTAMNARRQAASQKRTVLFEPSLAGQNVERDVDRARLAPIVRALIATLPQALAEALTLHVVLGYTVDEIADVQRVPRETVRSRLRLAKQALRKAARRSAALRESFEEEP